LPLQSVWTPDRSVFFVRANSHDTGPLVEIPVRTGAFRREGDPGPMAWFMHADPSGRILFAGVSGDVRLYDARRGQEIEHAQVFPLPGYPTTGPVGFGGSTAKDGSFYASRSYNASKTSNGHSELVRYDPDLKPVAQANLADDPESACLSADG